MLIVDDELWAHVQARPRSRSADTVTIECQPTGGRKPFARRGGHRSKFPLSGLLKCGDCGSSFVISDARNYACASRTNGSETACANVHRACRTDIEETLIDALRTKLWTPDLVGRFRRRVEQKLNAASKAERALTAGVDKRRARLEGEIANLLWLARSGVVLPTLAVETGKTEAGLAALTASAEPMSRVVRMFSRRRCAATRRWSRNCRDFSGATPIVRATFCVVYWAR